MKNSKFQIAIVGSGQLGSRHLQGLSKTKKYIEITVIDPNLKSLSLAKTRFNQIPKTNKVISIRYISNYNEINRNIDIAIIATNADVRRIVIEKLLLSTNVKYMILEKVAFQSINDFQTVISLLNKKQITAWVNCPRRMYSFFQNIKQDTLKAKSIKIYLEGSQWGLACNAIHFLDIFAFLTNESDLNININKLNKQIYSSKRDGFLEITGKLLVNSKRGDLLEMIDYNLDTSYLNQIVEIGEMQYIIENRKGIISSRFTSGKNIKKLPFELPLQSELTGLVVDKILEEGSSDLTPLLESFDLHKPMLKAFNNHFSSINKKNINTCPIT
tara:strand:+ start:903 stop:1889 length:987 start_codon:yes stop_codon:yes gene_type:complete